MSKLLDFLLAEDMEAGETAEVAISPYPFPFVVKAISEGENKKIRNSCRTVTFDKKTRQKTVEIDTDLYNNRLLVACCVDPNFKNADLQEKYGVRGAEALIDVMLKPGQFTDLLLAVQEINHFNDDMNDLRDEAKNSSPVETTE